MGAQCEIHMHRFVIVSLHFPPFHPFDDVNRCRRVAMTSSYLSHDCQNAVSSAYCARVTPRLTGTPALLVRQED
ncbi:hypothetical protein U1Q18_047521 [Sarracenia purpurea var. burkii]